MRAVAGVFQVVFEFPELERRSIRQAAEAMPQRAVGLVQRLGEDLMRVELEGPPTMDLGQHAGYFLPRPEEE